MNGGQLNCESISELLSPYIDDQVSEAERQSVETHVAACPRCAGELEELRLMVQTLGGMPTMRVPRSFALPADQRKPLALLLYLRTAATALAAVFLLAFLASAYLQVTSIPQKAVFSAASRPSLDVQNAPGAKEQAQGSDVLSSEAKRASEPAVTAPSAKSAAPAAGAASQSVAPGTGTAPQAPIPSAQDGASPQNDQASPLVPEQTTVREYPFSAWLPNSTIETVALILFIVSSAASFILWRR